MVIKRRIPIDVPDIGAGDEPVRFGQWLVDDGDAVLAGDRIAEVLTSGILFCVASPAEGTLIRGSIVPGATITVGETIGEIVFQDVESSGE